MTPEKARAFLGEPTRIRETPDQYVAGPNYPPRFVGRAYTTWIYEMPWDPLAGLEPCKLFSRDGVVQSIKAGEAEYWPKRICCSSQ